MSTVSSSSSFSTSAATNYGMSGLVSGLDTEGMVEQLLSGTQSKIDKQNAEKQQVMWKQEMYRDLIAEINSLKNSFFGTTSATNLGSSDFFNAMSVTTTSKAFEVTATSSAATGKTSVRVAQLATASRIQSGAAVSGILMGKINTAALERRVAFNTGTEENSVEVVVTLDMTKLTDDKEQNLKELAAQLSSAQGITATVIDGQLSIKGATSVSDKSTALGLEMLGLHSGEKSKDGTLSTAIKLDAQPSIEMELNGISRTIKLDGLDVSSDMDTILKTIQQQVDNAFGKGWITIADDGSGTGNFTMTTNGKGNVITLTGGDSGLALMGMERGASDKITRTQKLKDINFAQNLQGSVYKFTINGVDFSFTADKTLSEVMREINASDAGVRITYSEIEDKFNIESASTGKGYDITMEQTAGNLLGAMFGKISSLTTGKEIYSSLLTTNDGSELSTSTTLDKLELDLSTRPADYNLSDASTLQDLMDAIEEQVSKSTEPADIKVTVKLVEGRLQVTTSGDGQITFPPFLAALFGEGKISISQEVEGTEAKQEAGQNALVSINGVDIERSTNNFTVSGMSFSLYETTGKYVKAAESGMTNNNGLWNDGNGNSFTEDDGGYLVDASGSRLFEGTSEQVNTTRNTTQIFEGLKAFVDKYNTLIAKLNDMVSQEATYKEYAPLTDAQRKEMSDREIELWEQKAKGGLLRRDSNIMELLSSMRSALYTKPEGATYALYEIGIETSSDWRNNGKLVLDESKLKEMISSNAQAIENLFTSANSGLAAAMSKAIDYTAGTNSGSPGTLVSLAGVEGKASSVSNALTRRLIEINERITDLKAKYEKEKNRYWKQFNAMESALQSMNTQSSWLMQQFG